MTFQVRQENRLAVKPDLGRAPLENQTDFLTTITTVGGLTPMLFEQSRNALFLKPTVITLVYGLGVGFFIVLLVTPLMVAIQHDLRACLTSFRRMASHIGIPGTRRHR